MGVTMTTHPSPCTAAAAAAACSQTTRQRYSLTLSDILVQIYYSNDKKPENKN